MSDGLLAWISFGSFWGVTFLSPHFRWLFLFVSASEISLLWLPVFIGRPSVVGIIWNSVVHSLWFPDLDALWLSFIQFMWALLLYFGFNYLWLIHWWILSSSWLTGSHNPSTSCMLLYRCWLTKKYYPESQTHVSKNTPLPHQQYHQQLRKYWKYGTLRKSAYHPCTGAMLVLSISFQS